MVLLLRGVVIEGVKAVVVDDSIARVAISAVGDSFIVADRIE